MVFLTYCRLSKCGFETSVKCVCPALWLVPEVLTPGYTCGVAQTISLAYSLQEPLAVGWWMNLLCSINACSILPSCCLTVLPLTLLPWKTDPPLGSFSGPHLPHRFGRLISWPCSMKSNLVWVLQVWVLQRFASGAHLALRWGARTRGAGSVSVGLSANTNWEVKVPLSGSKLYTRTFTQRSV